MAAHPPTHEGEHHDQRERHGPNNDRSTTRSQLDAAGIRSHTRRQKKWEELGLPTSSELIGGFLLSNPLIWGVPDKKEIFRLDYLTTKAEQSYTDADHWMRLVVADCPLPYVTHEMAHHPLLDAFGGISLVEHNLNVRLTITTKAMHLYGIKVVSGDPQTDDPGVVFEGTELLGPQMQRRIRVIRVTVHTTGVATHEVISDTRYPEPLQL